MHAFHANSSMWQSRTAFPHLLPRCWCVRRNNSHSVAAKDNKKISVMHEPGTPALFQAQLCWQATTLCCRMVSRVTWNTTCHMGHCSIAQFHKDAHRHDLQEAGIVGVLPVVISAQVCISDVLGFFCMLEPGRNKLFSDYRDLSYMHIVLSYAVCLITNILEITDSSSGKPNPFL